MAQTGYTPIQLYRSTTASAAPSAGNLSPGELGFNINDADMALYAENASGTVKRIINNPAGLKYPTADGTGGQIFVTDGAGNITITNLISVNSSSAALQITQAGAGYGLNVSGVVNATTMSIGGTAVTSSAAELNILDGVTATTAEINILAGVTASATEINYNDITTLGTSQASKTVTADANGDVKFSNAVVETVYALSGTTPALNPTNGMIQTWTLSASSTPTDSLNAGESLTLMIDDGTAYTITWPSVTWKTDSGSAPTLNTTGYTAIVLWKVGATLYGARVGNA